MLTSKLVKITIFVSFLALIKGNIAEAQSTATESEPLNKILGIVCGAYENSGNNKEIELSGTAKAEINSLLKKLADAGANISGSFNVDQYVGVLQSDLQRDRASVRECRERVWRDLKDRVQLSTESNIKPPASTQFKAPEAAQKLTNSDVPIIDFSKRNRFFIEDYLEKDGISEKLYKIKTEKHCKIKTFSMTGPGKRFSFSLQSEKGAVFLRSISGHDGQATSIPPGTYDFIVRAIDPQGNYAVQISAECD